MLVTEDLTTVQWQTADAIARQLVIEGTDINELRKAIAYLRDRQERDNAGNKFFEYLTTLAKRGNTIGHSKRTVIYYQSLEKVCRQYLEKDYKSNAPQMLMILGWAARLVRYYDKGVPTGEIKPVEVMSEREAAVQAVTQANTFEVGQELQAVVTAIRNNKVTYELLGAIKLTQKEPKLAEQLMEGQDITVRIKALKDDGSIKSVKGMG